jgi:hypothetical protein
MKIRFIAPLAMTATAAVLGFAPIAAAAPTAMNAGTASVVQEPGNAQITATPGPAAQEAAQQQYPFFGYGYEGGLLFHNGGHR